MNAAKVEATTVVSMSKVGISDLVGFVFTTDDGAAPGDVVETVLYRAARVGTAARRIVLLLLTINMT